jgi:hypothetical protein
VGPKNSRAGGGIGNAISSASIIANASYLRRKFNMTRHDPTVRMRHMLDHVQEAVGLLAGKKKADLYRNRLLELALVRLIEIVGEAANKLPVEA